MNARKLATHPLDINKMLSFVASSVRFKNVATCNQITPLSPFVVLCCQQYCVIFVWFLHCATSINSTVYVVTSTSNKGQQRTTKDNRGQQRTTEDNKGQRFCYRRKLAINWPFATTKKIEYGTIQHSKFEDRIPFSSKMITVLVHFLQYY